jgi:hypothetical protein
MGRYSRVDLRVRSIIAVARLLVEKAEERPDAEIGP